ncbi:MAG: TlpA family protein disulfide reductase [Vicingaceae bacterium]
MNKSTLTFLAVVAFSFIALFSLSVQDNNHKLEEGRSERIGKAVLEELITKTNNEHPALNNELKGKTVMISVWATWCGPCREEIPELNQLVDQYKHRNDMAFIALDNEDSTRASATMERMNLNFNFDLYFNQNELINLLYRYKLPQENSGLPLTLVINKEGKLEFYYMGYDPYQLSKVKSYLAEI